MLNPTQPYPHRVSLCLLVLVIFIVSCNGQSRSNQTTNKPVPNLGNTDTASHLKFISGIRAILEDRKGNIWFGSHGEGVAVLKGTASAGNSPFGFGAYGANIFTYYDQKDGLSSSQIRSIYEDKNGHIWFEGGEGISSYDGTKITTHTDRNYQAKNEWQLNDDDLWFKGDEMNGYNDREKQPGVYQYDGKQFSYRTFPIKYKAGEENYYSVTTPFIKGKSGTLWFGIYGGVIGYTGSKFIVIDNAFLGLNQKTGFLHTRGLLEDSQGNLWIANNGIGVFKYNGKKAVDFTAQHQLKKGAAKNTLHRVFAIGEDGKGNIWFGTYKSGVWRYDGKSLKNFNVKDGLHSEQIWTIYKSKQGEMWFGGANPSGVYKFNGKSFERKF